MMMKMMRPETGQPDTVIPRIQYCHNERERAWARSGARIAGVRSEEWGCRSIGDTPLGNSNHRTTATFQYTEHKLSSRLKRTVWLKIRNSKQHPVIYLHHNYQPGTKDEETENGTQYFVIKRKDTSVSKNFLAEINRSNKQNSQKLYSSLTYWTINTQWWQLGK